MRAVLTPRYGSSDVLTFAEVSAPTPAAGEILVDVHAAAVTRGDDRLRGAEFPGFTAVIGRSIFGFTRPRQPLQGTMFAGRVAAIGEGVTRFAVGDDVFGEVANGAYAEQLVVREDAGVAHVPDGFDFTDVAPLGYGAVTSLVFLRDIGAVQPGEHVVVVGAGGGVGRYAVQVASHLGARVTAVASARHDALLRDLGVETIVRPGEALPATADVVFDTSGTSHVGDWRDQMAATGRFLTTDLTVRLIADLLLANFRSGPRTRFGVGEVTADNLATVAELLESGALRPVIGHRFAFEDAAAAHRCVHEERPNGDVVIEVRASREATVTAMRRTPDAAPRTGGAFGPTVARAAA